MPIDKINLKNKILKIFPSFTKQSSLEVEDLSINSFYLPTLGHSKLYKIRLSNDINKMNIIGKIAPKIEYNNMRYLWDSFYSSNGVHNIPEPYGYISDDNLLLMSYQKGYNLKKVFLWQCSKILNNFQYLFWY